MSWAAVAAASKANQAPSSASIPKLQQVNTTQVTDTPQETEKTRSDSFASLAQVLPSLRGNEQEPNVVAQQKQQAPKLSWAALASKRPAKVSPSEASEASNTPHLLPNETKTRIENFGVDVSLSSTPPVNAGQFAPHCWSSLPKDIIAYHLLPQIEHASSFRVLRLLSRHWHEAISVPTLHSDSKALPDDLCHLATTCEKIVIGECLISPSKKLLEALNQNRKLKHYRLDYNCDAWNLSQNFKLINCFQNFQKLESVFLGTTDMPEARVQALLEKLLAASTPNLHTISLKDRYCHKDLVFVAQKKNIRHLSISCRLGVKEHLPILNHWLTHPSCSLESLTICKTDAASVDLWWFVSFLTAIKRNSSLRRLQLRRFEFSSTIFEALQGHPSIKDLELLFLSPRGSYQPFLKMLANTRIERLDTNFAPDCDDHNPESLNLLCDVLIQNRIPKTFCRLPALLPDRDPGHPIHDALLDALAKNTSIDQLNYSGSEYRAELVNHFIAKSFGLRTVALRQVDALDEEQIKIRSKFIGKAKHLEDLEVASFQDQKPTWKRALLLGLKPLRALRRLSLRRVVDDSLAPLVATIIQKNQYLSNLNVEQCALSTASLTLIFEAASKASALREMSLYECGDFSGSPDASLNPAIAAVFQKCKLEKFSILRTKLDAAAVNAIISAILDLESCYLRRIEFCKGSISSALQPRLENLERQKSGLLRIYVRPF